MQFVKTDQTAHVQVDLSLCWSHKSNRFCCALAHIYLGHFPCSKRVPAVQSRVSMRLSDYLL